MSYDEIEDPFDMMDEDEIEDYNRKYLSEVERSGSRLSESERGEVFQELQNRHNIRRTSDGASDGRRSYLEAKNVVEEENKNVNPHLAALMKDVDSRKGVGEGKKC